MLGLESRLTYQASRKPRLGLIPDGGTPEFLLPEAHPRGMPSPAPMGSGSRHHGRGAVSCHSHAVIRAAYWRGKAVLWFVRCQREASLLPRASFQLPSCSFLGLDSPSGRAVRWAARKAGSTKSGSRLLSPCHEGTGAQVTRTVEDSTLQLRALRVRWDEPTEEG